MQKLFLPLLFGCFLFLQSNAQKTTVAIKLLRTVKASGYGNQTTSDAKIEDFVTEKFVETKKFDIVDRASMDALKSEKELQKSEDFVDGKVIEQSKTLGADYLVGIYISDLNVTSRTSSTMVSYGCKMNFSVKVIDIASSQVMASDVFSSSAGTGLLSFYSSGDAAAEKCLNNLAPKIEEFIKDNFPLKVSLASIEESDAAGAATKILISAGSSNGVKVGDKFKIIEVLEIEVDGKKMSRKKEVGNVQVSSIEDENFSVCTVSNGGADITKKKGEGKKLQAIGQPVASKK